MGCWMELEWNWYEIRVRIGEFCLENRTFGDFHLTFCRRCFLVIWMTSAFKGVQGQSQLLDEPRFVNPQPRTRLKSGETAPSIGNGSGGHPGAPWRSAFSSRAIPLIICLRNARNIL